MPINNQNIFFVLLSFITMFALIHKVTLMIIRHLVLAGNIFVISQNYF